MTYKQTRDIWNDTLMECLGCYADAFGNRLCDYGCLCDKCNADWVQKIYHNKLEMAERTKGVL